MSELIRVDGGGTHPPGPSTGPHLVSISWHRSHTFPPGIAHHFDDLSPEVDMTQSAIALLRQQMEYGHIYDMTKLAQNPVRSPRPTLRCLHAIGATRLRETRPWSWFFCRIRAAFGTAVAAWQRERSIARHAVDAVAALASSRDGTAATPST